MSDADALKKAAARAALDHVEAGMHLGLGTGSTAAYFIAELGERVARGLAVSAVPTSEATKVQAEKLAIPLVSLDDVPSLDLTVDGADEIDSRLRLIKGGGGALLREKIVAAASLRMIVIADETKRVERLGAFPLPVEVVKFGAEATVGMIAKTFDQLGLSGAITRRTVNDVSFLTDGDNFIYDCALGAIADPEALAAALNAIPGVVEHGLFLDLADLALIGTDRGVIEIAKDEP